MCVRTRTAKAVAIVAVALAAGPASLLLGDEPLRTIRHGQATLDRNAAACDLCHEPAGGAGGSGGSVAGETGTLRPAAPLDFYRSDTMDASFVGLSRTTQACLGCHDGTIASDVAGDGLGNDHPVGFAYDAALTSRDRGLHDPSTAPSGLGGTIEKDLLDRDGTLQCASCHVFHNESDRLREPGLLKVSNRGSAMCVTCHEK